MQAKLTESGVGTASQFAAAGGLLSGSQTLVTALPCAPTPSLEQTLHEENQALRLQVEELETALVVQKREQSIAQSELMQASARTAAAHQVIKAHEEAMAHLLGENKSLVEEREHLRTILNSKDQMIAEVREAPQTLMTEIVQLRHQCEEAISQRKWMDAERDAAQFELSRQSLRLSQAEEELRRLRHQNEQLERLNASKHDSGAELSRVVRENSSLSVALAQLREKLMLVKQQLGVGHKGISVLVSELGAKIYALRAAIARMEGAFSEPGSSGPIHDTLDQILAHLNDGNAHVHALRELIEQAGAEVRTDGLPLPG